MNYLAHAFLSNNDHNLLVGNFIADHLRGNKFDGIGPEILKGIQLHRKIDAYSDTHPHFRASKRFFYQGFERYSGILVDIYFDHLLAKHWEKHAAVPLSIFAKEVYKVYHDYRGIMPQRSNRFLDYVLSNNIYEAYKTEEGIFTVLFHLSHRISHGVSLDQSKHLFKANLVQLEEHFSSFFEDAKKEFL